MKKFLSVILMLTMLIAPVGAVSCFADGEKDVKSAFDIMREGNVSKFQADIVLLKDGRYLAQMSLFGEDGQYLGTEEANERAYKTVGKTLIELRLMEIIRTLGCDKVHIVFEKDLGGHYSINANFYDAEGIIVKTFKKEGYENEVEIGI